MKTVILSILGVWVAGYILDTLILLGYMKKPYSLGDLLVYPRSTDKNDYEDYGIAITLIMFRWYPILGLAVGSVYAGCLIICLVANILSVPLKGFRKLLDKVEVK